MHTICSLTTQLELITLLDIHTEQVELMDIEDNYLDLSEMMDTQDSYLEFKKEKLKIKKDLKRSLVRFPDLNLNYDRLFKRVRQVFTKQNKASYLTVKNKRKFLNSRKNDQNLRKKFRKSIN